MSAERKPPVAVVLSVPARSEYLALCRLALAGLATIRPLTDEELADLKLVLTEACSNVVRHAYTDGDGDGRIVVSYELRPADGLVTLVVADDGRGMTGDDGASEGQGLGLRLIEALTDEVEIATGRDGRGTVVRMARRLAARPG